MESRIFSYFEQDPGHKPLSCPECEFRCRRTSELNRHRRKKHGSGGGVDKDSSPFSCADCGRRFSALQHLKRHQASAHADVGEKKRVLAVQRCRLCDYSTTSAEGIRKHVLKTGKGEGRNWHAFSVGRLVRFRD